MGRKFNIEEGDMIAVTGKTSRSRLQLRSDRRAVVDKLVGLGGRALTGELNEAFGFDIRTILNALVNDGWLEVIDNWEGEPPLPTRWPSESKL